MASNLNMERQQGKGADRKHSGDVPAESCDILKHLLPAAVASSQDGEQAVCEGLASEQEATERRRSGVSELRHNISPSAHQRPLDELPRLNFQIPRKSKERKALFQSLSQGSRELEDIVKILSSCYRDASSAGTFSYTKARLVHSELLEKDFVEKRRELKQDGRTDKELVESYCFLLPDPSKLHWICEKGLSVGHTRITTLGNPAKGVYLSKYSDLLQINPFDLGATGDIIIFKVIKGKVKSIYENMSKTLLDPTPKFDCHISKNAARVTSLLSYRGFELTQQYFYEYSFDEIKHRPRHVCPYAVVSFLHKGKEATAPAKSTAPLSFRSNCSTSDGNKARSSYTVWSGQLLNGGKVVYQVALRSSTRPFLPFKLPEKLEIGTVMNLEQVKRKIPTVLFSWDTYSGAREVLKSGMYCSLFEVVDRSKHGNSLTALLHKLERERMVLVNPLLDKGFLFLLSSAQMVNSNERRGGWTRCLQALFVFQESRGVTKLSSKRPTSHESLQPDTQHPIMPQLDTFIPALHYALMKLRSNPPPELGSGVERQARDYLSGQDEGKVRLYYMTEYKLNLDEREKLHPAPKQKHNLEGYLRSYIYRPDVYLLAVVQAREMVESLRRVPEYSPVSDWEGSDGPVSGAAATATATAASATQAAAQANGAHGAHGAQADNDPEKMRELLKLIQMWKRNEGEARHAGDAQEGREGPEEPVWEARGLKRKLEEETAANTFKYLRSASLDNGEHSRDEEAPSPPSLSAVMTCMGIRDTDLRKDESHSTSRLIEMLATLHKAKKGSSGSLPDGPISPDGGPGGGATEGPEPSEPLRYDTMIKLALPTCSDVDLRIRAGEEGQDDLDRSDYLEEQTAGSMSSLEVFSPCSSNEQHRGADNEGQMPWFLIPITGIKSEKYCLREEDNPQDPRFLHNPMVSAPNTPEKSHSSLSQPVEDTYLQVGGDEEEMEQEEAAPVGGASGPNREVTPIMLDNIIDEALGHFSVGMRDILREGQVNYNPGPTPIPLEQHQQLWAPGVAFSEYISHYTSSFPVHGYVTRLCEQMNSLIHPEQGLSSTATDAQHLLLSSAPDHTPTIAPVSAHTPTPAPVTAHTHTLAPVPAHTPTLAPIPAHTHTLAPVPAHTPTLAPVSGHTPTHAPTYAPVPAHTPTLAPVPAHTPTLAPVPAHTPTLAPVPAHTPTLAPVPPHTPTLAPVPAHSPGLTPLPALVPAPGPTTVSAPHSNLAPAHFPLAPALGTAPSSSLCTAPLPVKSQASPPHRQSSHSLPRLGTIKEAAPLTSKSQGSHRRTPRQDGGVLSGARATSDLEPDGRHNIPLLAEAPPTPCPAPDSGPASISSLISQLKPEVFSSLVEIIKDVQKNAVKFYIHSQEEEESEVCVEIKEYLIRLGNVECNPQAFLESKNNLDKLLIIIQNEDIAAHVHKIPALVSLKKLPSVSFAGVDSLDDVKNHTYNELFVSGGFIVSDEFVLNPDFITHERLQTFLTLLEQRSSPETLWQWKVHCKTQKKLKELGRLNSDALGLLNLLTTYQKRHLVEFLPYHECDAPSRHAPDLDCLIRLQAHHTQHRHILFLTERRLEMFPHYSSNGIVIASIDDIMNSFHSLIGFHDNTEEPCASDNHPPQTPPTVPKDECVEEEDMSLDSEDDTLVIEEPSVQIQEMGAEDVAQQPPLPQAQEFRPPLPNQNVLDRSVHMSFLQPSSGETSKPLDFEALKSAISQFKASSQRQPLDYEVGGSSPGAFKVNPHQSFLCPLSLQTASYQGPSGYAGPLVYPNSPCSALQEAAPALSHSLPLGQDDLRSAVTLPSSLPGPGGPLDGTSHVPGNPALGPLGLVAPTTSGACYLALGDTGAVQHSWGHLGGVSSACGTPTSQDDGALVPALETPRGKAPTPGSGNSASGTPNSQEGATPGLASFSTQGAAKTSNPGGSSTPSSQGSLTPVPSKVVEKATAPTPTAVSARGGAQSSGLLPHPQGAGSVNGRGRGGGPGPIPFDNTWGNGAGAVAMGYRGLPLSRSRPRGCRELRGGACIRGFPLGRGRGQHGGYYTDFTQDTYLSWGEGRWSPGDGYGTHRDGYNGW